MLKECLSDSLDFYIKLSRQQKIVFQNWLLYNKKFKIDC